jgi:predicted alpha/beta superfamily hydrolase
MAREDEGQDLFKSPSGSTLLVTQITARALHENRFLYIYLPSSYEFSTKRYPVFYFQDGQNLFDCIPVARQTWNLNQSLDHLATLGIEIIVVGVEHGHEDRIREYNPFIGEKLSNKATRLPYLEFLTHEVKPYIDQQFRTLPERTSTGIAGSSLGGLISLCGFIMYPDFFGMTASLSNWMWVRKDVTPERVYNLIQVLPSPPGRLVLDIGDLEYVDTLITGTDIHPDQLIVETRQLRDLLIQKGYVLNRNLLYVEVNNGRHTELDWGKRIEGYLHFLLG